MVAAVQTSILLGAVLGGLLLDGWSVTATLGGSVFLSLAGVALIGNGQKMLKPGSENQ